MNQDNETWLAHAKSIWKAQVYIQEHLDEELTLELIAKAANFSPHHFHRIFRAFTGETLNDYVRRLRIEKAAGRLIHSNKSITDIALESGYQTPSSFTRAFQKIMGNSPHGYRQKGVDKIDDIQKKQPRKEKIMLKPEIKHIEDQEVLFVRKEGSYQETPAKAWKSILTFAKAHPRLENARRFGIGNDDPNITEIKKLRYDACLAAPKEQIEKGEVGRQVLKGGKYAVFDHKGPYETLEVTYDAIFQDWYPSYDGEVAEKPCFCEHFNMELLKSNPEDLISKIYIPLK